MRIRKVFFCILIIGFVFIGVLTSCGDKNDASVNLVYWSMWNSTEPQATVMQEAIDDFMQKNPDVNIDINWNGREIRKTLQPALDNGQEIDIWDEDLETVIKNWGDYALRLDDYLAISYDTTNDVAYEHVVMKNLLQLARYYSQDSGIYAVPYQPFVFAFMYNKEHFQKAGIQQVPTTWKDFLMVCKRLKQAGFTPLTTDDAYIDTLLGYHLARLKGSAWVETLVQDTSRDLWGDKAVMQTAKDFQELVNKHYLSETVGANKWPAGQQDVAAGTVSMYLNGTWLVNEIMTTTGPDFQWGTFAYPAIDGGVDGINAANYGSQAFQINKKSEHPDIAFKLLVHLTTGKWDSILAEKSFGVPVSKNGEWPTQLLEAKEVFEHLDISYPWAGGIRANVDMQPVISEAFTKLLSGALDAEGFVQAVRKRK